MKHGFPKRVKAKWRDLAKLAVLLAVIAWAIGVLALLTAERHRERAEFAWSWRGPEGGKKASVLPTEHICGRGPEEARVKGATEDFSRWRVEDEEASWASSNDAEEAGGATATNKLRVAVFTGAYSHIRDGVSLTLNRLVAFLEQRGHDALVFAPTSAEPALHHAGKLIPVPSLPAPGRPDYRVSLGLTAGLKDQLQAFQPHLVHIATPDVLGFQALSWAEQAGLPVVCSYHTHFAHYLHYYHLDALEPGSWRLIQAFYDSCEHTYVPTKSVADELRHHGVTSSELRVWGRGLDYSAFNPQHRCERWREGIGATQDAPVLLLVCRLVWEKALDVFADAVLNLRARGIKFKPVVVGNGPAFNGLSQLIPEAVFLGSLDGADLARAYASSDVFLFPSDTETFGITTLEAMGSGLPTIVANSTAASDLVQHGKTGFLAPPHDASAFADFAALLLADSDRRRSMGRAAREHAVSSFRWSRSLRDLLRNYRVAVSSRRRRRGNRSSAWHHSLFSFHHSSSSPHSSPSVPSP